MEPRVLVGALAELAGLEEEMVDARGRIERRDRRGARLRDLEAELRLDDDAAADTARGDRVAARMREAELRDLEAQLATRRDRLIGITDRRQHRALQEEIAALERRLDELETTALTALEDADRSAGLESEARAELERQAERGGEELAALESAAAQAEAAVAAIAEDLQRVLAALPPDVAAHVRRLRQRHPRAVVRVTGGACGGCFAQLPTQAAVDAERGKAAVRCPSCGRYVVHQPWSGT